MLLLFYVFTVYYFIFYLLALCLYSFYHVYSLRIILRELFFSNSSLIIS